MWRSQKKESKEIYILYIYIILYYIILYILIIAAQPLTAGDSQKKKSEA